MKRIAPVVDLDELTTLTQFLDYHRATLVMKVSSLDAQQLNARPIPSSELSLAGLVKHLALVEDNWFQEVFLGAEMPEPWASAPFDEDPDWDFHSAAADTSDGLLDLYAAACARSRSVVIGAESLDQGSVQIDRLAGTPFSLRWILMHMVEETARHNGHADLLREALDGVAGE